MELNAAETEELTAADEDVDLPDLVSAQEKDLGNKIANGMVVEETGECADDVGDEVR